MIKTRYSASLRWYSQIFLYLEIRDQVQNGRQRTSKPKAGRKAAGCGAEPHDKGSCLTRKMDAKGRPFFCVRITGFEPVTSCLSSKRSEPTELNPQIGGAKRNRTAVPGFADLCLTARPSHRYPCKGIAKIHQFFILAKNYLVLPRVKAKL